MNGSAAGFFLRVLGCGLTAFAAAPGHGEDATFFRGVNLNGPALTIEGHAWDGSDAANLTLTGNRFENQKVPLKPPVDAARTRMIRSSVWGDKVDVVLTSVPEGDYQVFLYVWEDNHNERFSLLVNDKVMVEAFESGTAGIWKKLGPWPAVSAGGKLKVSARTTSHGAANLSGLEVWSGRGTIPAAPGSAFVNTPTPEQVEFFERKVRPVLVENCYECHSAGAKKLRGGLLLDSRAGVHRGGETGPAISPGDPDASLLILAVRRASDDTAMPPKKKLPPEMVADLEAWVRMGAPDPRTEDTVAALQAKSAIDWTKARTWWSFRPLNPPAVPAVADAAWPANDVDRFTLARMEAAGLPPAPDADQRTLLRRATYDLTGLPPTPAEVEAFVADDSPGAFAAVVDRLLASTRYGERWGRHWLDVVRYADTAGDNSDFPIPQIHRYRDWVIAAFNRDLRYDEFVRQQLAGDLLEGGSDEERLDRVVATGYIANSRRFGSRVDDYPQHLTIEDTIDNVGRTFLGLTINCARCHDHKFDPITTQDYYAMFGIFHSTRYPWPGIELDQKQRDFVPLVPAGKLAAAKAAQQEHEKELARLDKEWRRLKDSLKDTPAEKKKSVEEAIKAAEKIVADFRRTAPVMDTAYAVAESAKIGDTAVQQKGDPAKPGPVVKRRFLTVFGGTELPADDASSGRRALAEWILAKDNPLPARVMVNRIWQHHFGRGLVPTPNDFGRNGKPATHPELLDWLALKLRDGGWSIKAMHRLIMLSHTYRQSSARTPAAVESDPANEWLAGFPRRRLDAESIRDTLLMLGGNLDFAPAGAHPFPAQSEWKFTQHNPFKALYDTNRRSVYLMTQRIQRHPYLAVFDGADPSTSTPARLTSTTPLQSLFLLNDPLVHQQSERVVDGLLAGDGDDAARVHRAYTLLFSRPPADDEIAAAATYLTEARTKTGDEKQAWRSYVRVLFRLNEFVYID